MADAAGTDLRLLVESTRQDTARWLDELEHDDQGLTGTRGKYGEACGLAEHLLRATAAVVVHLAGSAGRDAVRRATAGKADSVERLTLGDCKQLIEVMDKQRLLEPGGRVLSRGEATLIKDVVSSRNRFVHGPPRAPMASHVLSGFLTLVRELAESAVVGIRSRRTVVATPAPRNNATWLVQWTAGLDWDDEGCN